jgi:predicted PurR-regulated permease PerM
MTSATMVSTLIIGIIEGLFGGILFLIFGLPSPVLWGVVMLIVSMIPLVGTNVIIVPAGIVMIASGRYFAGIVIIILGLVGITLSQNLLKPKLLGNRSGLHPALVLISTLGAIIWIGVIGFLVGPLMASLFIVVWNQFGFKYREELDSRNSSKEEDSETTEL